MGARALLHVYFNFVILSHLTLLPFFLPCADLKSLPGVSEPFPEVFDPLNLSATASIRDIRRWRESELTHGEWLCGKPRV